MNYNRILSILLFLFFLVPLNAAFAAGTQDTTAPELLTVEMLDTTVAPGESFKFKVKTSDDFSGIQSITASFTSPTKQHYVHSSVSIYKQAADNYYTITSSPINNYAEEGTWYLSSLIITDHANNALRKSYGYDHYFEKPIATFQVVNNQKDTTMPELLAVEMLDTTVAPGESFKFKVKTSDDLSGIQSITASFTSPTKQHYVHSSVSIYKQAADNYYTITSNPINNYAEEGTWYLSDLIITDHANNTLRKSYGFDHYFEKPIATFQVVNNQKDTTMPELLAVEMLDTTVAPGESFKFKVKTSDDLSGIQSITASFTSPTQQHYVHSSVSIYKQAADNYYTITTNPINNYAEEGTWYLSSLIITDHANNALRKSYGYDYYFEKPIATIKVQSKNETVDKTPPVLDYVQVLDQQVNYGKKVRFKIKALDDKSGLKDIQLALKSAKSAQTFYVNAPINQTTTNHEYILETDILTNNYTQGEWYISNIIINDKQSNKFEKNYLSTNTVGRFMLLTDVVSPPIDGFENMEPKYNVALDKEWKITFSLDFDIKTILNKNIYITNPYGVKVPLKFIIDRGSNGQSSQLTIVPLDPYTENTTYTLWIKDILSLDGKVLKQNVKMEFTTVKLSIN